MANALSEDILNQTTKLEISDPFASFYQSAQGLFKRFEML